MGKTALKVSEFHSVTGKIPYGIYRPEGDAPDKGFPLIVYLHGAGERGEPFEKVYRHSLPRYIQAGESFPAVILVPQCPGRVVWNNIVFGLKELIDSVIREYRIDPRRVSITGQSMGGFGTWEMGLTYSNFFSCMAPGVRGRHGVAVLQPDQYAGLGFPWGCGRGGAPFRLPGDGGCGQPGGRRGAADDSARRGA